MSPRSKRMRVAAVCLQAALLTASTFGDFGGSPPISRVIGASSAEAKSFYTRKRVNGRWIAGRFAKRRIAAKQRAAARTGGRAAIGVSGISGATTPLLSGPEAERPFMDAFVLSASPPNSEHMLRLEQALKAHAQRLRTAITTERASPADNLIPFVTAAANTSAVATPRVDARSVWLDFDSGVKTTLFRDGTTTEEAFDIQALRELAASLSPAKR